MTVINNKISEESSICFCSKLSKFHSKYRFKVDFIRIQEEIIKHRKNAILDKKTWRKRMKQITKKIGLILLVVGTLVMFTACPDIKPKDEAPDTPDAPTLTPGDAKLTASWSAVSGADSYTLCYGTQNDSSASTEVTGIKSRNYEINGLTNGTTYYVWLKVKNSEGSSGYSAAASAIPAVPRPGVPNAPRLSVDDSQIIAQWDAVSEATSYEVWYHTADDSANATKFDDTDDTDTNCVITGLNNSTTYYVWLKAININGTSNFSNVASATPVAASAAPEMPSGLTPSLEAGNEKIIISWEPVEGATKYNIYYSTSSDFAGETTQSDITGLSYTLTSLTNGTEYWVRIKAGNSIGYSTEYSNSASATPIADTEPPAKPIIKSVLEEDKQLTVEWLKNNSATSYKLYHNTTNDSSTATEITGITNLTYIITNLDNFTTYYVWVVATNAVGDSPYSDSATGAPITTPATPSISVTDADAELIVSWEAVPGADTYSVHYNTTNTSGTATEAVSGIASTSYTITELTNGTTYYVWAKAKNEAGESDFSSSETGNPKPIPVAPTISVAVGNAQLEVTWGEVDYAETYKLYYNTTDDSSSATEFTGDADNTDNTCTITDLTNFQDYYIWVKAVNNVGESGFSSSATGQPAGSPAKPEVTLTAGDGQITVSWNAVLGADSYEVYSNTSDASGSAIKFTGDTDNTDTTCTITGLANNQEYFVWVKAVNNTAGSSDFSDVQSATPNVAPAAPTGVTAAAGGDTELVITWTEPSTNNAASYKVYYNTTDDSSSATEFTGDATNTDTTCTITGLTNFQDYYVWVKAVNDVGESPFSSSASGQPVGTPEAPVVTLTAGDKQITVNWATVPGATSYDVYYNTLEDTTGLSPTNTTSTSHTIENLTNGTTYYVWVTAKYDTYTSDFSTGVTGLPIAGPPTDTPYLDTITYGNESITIEWVELQDATGYNIYYSTSATPTEPPQIENVTGNSYTITGLTNNTTYYVCIKGRNSAGVGSEFSNIKSTTPIYLETYTITYDANGATGTAPSVQTVTENDRVHIASVGELTNDGKLFLGWNTLQTPTNENPGVYYDGGTYIVADANLTLYAVWQAYTQASYFEWSGSYIRGLKDDFKNTITNLVLPPFTESGSAATNVSDGAFEGDTAIETVVIPNGLEVGSNCFKSCAKLTSIRLPSTLNAIAFGLVSGCTSLKSFVVPDQIITLNEYAFNGCTNLESIVIPEGVTKIERYCFTNCSSLKELYLPKTISTINDYFDGCTSLYNIFVDNGNEKWFDIDGILYQKYNGEEKLVRCPIAKDYDIVVPSNIDKIQRYSFSDSKITSITIKGNVNLIENEAFKNTDFLTSAEIEGQDCIIGDKNFYECSSLESVTLTGVKTIGDGVINSCGVTSVSLSEGLETIDNYFVRICTNIKTITIPASVQSIGKEFLAFSSGVENITIKRSIIGDESITTLGIDPLKSVTNNFTIYVPADSVDAYKTAPNWSNYADKIQAMP